MTPQDSYFNKLQKGAIKTAIVSCSDDHVEREIQTDPVEHENKFNQWPDDIMVNYNKDKSTYQRKKKREN